MIDAVGNTPICASGTEEMMVSKLGSVFKTKMPRLVLTCALTCGSLALHGASVPATTVNWQTLQTLNSDLPLAKQNTAAQQLDGKVVNIPGFMVPLEDDSDNVTEFLLVPYAGACIHVPPPPPNQIVYVKMNSSQKVKVTFTDPIMVTGQLKISTVVSPYGDVSYDLSGTTVKPYQQ
jgi:hypothetical protein